jgi:hypothetical protein
MNTQSPTPQEQAFPELPGLPFSLHGMSAPCEISIAELQRKLASLETKMWAMELELHALRVNQTSHGTTLAAARLPTTNQ